ncbi:MAG TPA: hypothetical protein VIV11_36675 [Kofleriaceae bacterium]
MTRFMLPALALLLLIVAVAGASHSHNGSVQLHISTIHDNNGTSTAPGSLDEEYCIQSHTSEVSTTALGDYIETMLTKRPGKHWDGAASWRVDLWRTAKPCNQYTSAERAAIEVEYHVATAWPSVPLCGNTTYSCTVLSKPTLDPLKKHQHYDWAVIHFQSRHVRGLDERARNFINHETGHVLGLADPRWAGDCSESVMHNALYGCNQFAYVTYPTASDLASVARIAARQN